MSEPTTSESTSRRRPGAASSDNPGGGLKVIAALLAIVVVALAFTLYRSKAGKSTQADADAKTISTLSNEVAELRTKLALEHSNFEVAQSNHQAALHRRTIELVTTSNRLVQTSLLLDRAREETRVAQAEIPAKATALAMLEAQRDELQRQVAAIPGLQRELADLKQKRQQAQFSYVALQETLGRVRTEKADLERMLDDPTFLRVQARRLENDAEIRQRAAANRRTPPTDPRVRLDLQPDGTVRPAIASTTTTKE